MSTPSDGRGTATFVRSPEHEAFETATRPDPLGALPVGGGWTGFGGAHGGLLVAAAARAMAPLVTAPDRPLRMIHVDFEGAVQPGLLEFDVALDRSGRSVAFTRAMGRQAGRARLAASAVFGDAGPGVEYPPANRGVRPVVPGPEAVDRWDAGDGPALSTVEFRPAKGPLPMDAVDVADFHCWIRIAGDDAPVDAARALTLLDAPAPGLYATVREPFAIPTVELTAHLLPALDRTTSPWALARMQTVIATGSYAIDDCELWNEDGELIAMARQTRRELTL